VGLLAGVDGHVAAEGVEGFLVDAEGAAVAGGEAYLFAALVYFVFCFAMSRYSKKLELNPSGSSPRLPTG